MMSLAALNNSDRAWHIILVRQKPLLGHYQEMRLVCRPSPAFLILLKRRSASSFFGYDCCGYTSHWQIIYALGHPDLPLVGVLYVF
jgi:hypothetical protein